MSLLLRKRLTVTLYPDRLVVVRSSQRGSALVGTPETLEFETVSGLPLWQAALAALKGWLQQHDSAKAEMECLLSDRFVRYALIPWSPDVYKPAELEALARIRFETDFGDEAKNWIIKSDCREYGKAGIACAIDRELFAGLRTLADSHRIKLISIRSRWMEIYNRWRKRFGAQGLFVVVEQGQCIFATLKDGVWHSLRTLKLPAADIEQSLRMSIEREAVLQGLSREIAVYLHVEETVDKARFNDLPQIVWLEGEAELRPSPGTSNILPETSDA